MEDPIEASIKHFTCLMAKEFAEEDPYDEEWLKEWADLKGVPMRRLLPPTTEKSDESFIDMSLS